MAHVALLGDPASWEPAQRFDSVALAVIGSVWSLGVRWSGVQNVIARYQAARGGDSPLDLATFIGRVGGPDAFARVVNNRQRTSSRNGILKAQAVQEAAWVLVGHGIYTLDDLRSAPLEKVRRQWIAVHGQRSGLSWDYFLMLLGFEGVKADRMVQRFIGDALGIDGLAVSVREAKALVSTAARLLDVSLTQLDYTIWRYQSGRQ